MTFRSRTKFLIKVIFFSSLGICICIGIALFFIRNEKEDLKLSYFFDREPFIHPCIIDDLAVRSGDSGDQIVEINLLESQKSNRYFGEIHCDQSDQKYPFVSVIQDWGSDSYPIFSYKYQYIGKTSDAIHVVLRKRKDEKTSICSQSILFLEFKKDQKMHFEQIPVIANVSEREKRERVLIRKLGELRLSEDWQGKILLNERTLSMSGLGELKIEDRPRLPKPLCLPFFLYKDPYINPQIINELLSWMSDWGDQVVAINLLDSQHSIRFHCENVGMTQLWANSHASGNSFFQYAYLGKTADAVHLLRTSECPGGSGVFINLLMIVFETDRGLSADWTRKCICWNKERLLIKKLGEMSFGDRTYHEMKIEGNKLLVGPDEGWFSHIYPEEENVSRTFRLVR